MNRRFLTLGNLALVLLFGSGVALLQRARLNNVLSPPSETLTAQAKADTQREVQRLAVWRNLPDFGFRNLVADWVFLNFLQYFGNFEQRQVTGYGLSSDYFEVILNRDPFYYLFYMYLSSSASIFAGQADRAVALQEKYLTETLSPRIPPESFYIWRHKGIDEVLFLNNLAAAQQSHRMAAEWAEQSSDPNRAELAASFRRYADFLATNPDATQLQINAWAQILMSAPDQKTRAVATENIRALGGDVVQDAEGRFSIRFPEDKP